MSSDTISERENRSEQQALASQKTARFGVLGAKLLVPLRFAAVAMAGLLSYQIPQLIAGVLFTAPQCDRTGETDRHGCVEKVRGTTR